MLRAATTRNVRPQSVLGQSIVLTRGCPRGPHTKSEPVAPAVAE